MNQQMGKNPLSYPQMLKVGAIQEDEALRSALIAAIAQAGGRARPLKLEADDSLPSVSEFLLLGNLILIVSPAALRSLAFQTFLQRAWQYEAHIHPPTVLLLVLAAPLEEAKAWPWLRELPCITLADGQPFPPEEAVRHTLQSLGLTPSDPPLDGLSLEALLLRGKVLWKLKQKDGGLACLKRVVERAPTSFRGWYTLGACLGWLPECKEEALAAFEHALALEPEAVHAWTWQGALLKELGRRAESRAAYERALACDTEGILSWEERARLLHYELKHYEAALAAYEQIARQYPEEVFMFFDMGLVLGLLGRAEEALAAYDRYLARYPEAGDAWYNQAELYEQLDRDEEALHALDHAQGAYEADKAADPKDRADVWHHRAVVLHKCDRLVEALQAVDRALELFGPGETAAANTWSLQGLILHELQREEEALQAFDQALTLCSSKTSASDQLWKQKAEVLRGLGREQEAQGAEAKIHRQSSEDSA
jgi:tetratricopeptide (TPR) repeat protein